ncbi:Exopolygalacturonase [Raphanus sativus]|nr:Exopolygalacturonase [Raphanus sativus]
MQQEIFDVSEFGASPNADSDNTLAFGKTWEAACNHQGRSKFYVPGGKFLVGEIEFKGPCRTESTMEVEITGDLIAPTSIKVFPSYQWITFSQLNDIFLYGSTNLEGRGDVEAWKQEGCKESKCGKLITSLSLANVSNAIIKDVSLSNAKGFHLRLHSSRNVTVHNVSFSSPWDSPNTDGIHVHSSSIVNITNSTIGVGDDCVSISTGSLDVLVSGTRCGPGHGFSIGSLGKVENEEEVRRIKVQNCTVDGAANGVRIKTWPASPPSQASDITFEDILMINVSNPIIIDQEYCPSDSCNTTSASRVKLSNIEFNNIRGTYGSDFGVNLKCSSLVACENITLIDVNLNGTKTSTDKWQQEKFSTKGWLNGLAVFNSTFN